MVWEQRLQYSFDFCGQGVKAIDKEIGDLAFYRGLLLVTIITAKDGAAQPTMNSAPLTYSVFHSTYINNKQSTVSPVHHWYEAKRPGGSPSLQCSRQEKSIRTHFGVATSEL
ncbi:RNase H domain-containing protein [Trichonephila clavipes]|nr:RNase H domain-containing protein [Trichonephila clavipes]